MKAIARKYVNGAGKVRYQPVFESKDHTLWGYVWLLGWDYSWKQWQILDTDKRDVPVLYRSKRRALRVAGRKVKEKVNYVWTPDEW